MAYKRKQFGAEPADAGQDSALPPGWDPCDANGCPLRATIFPTVAGPRKNGLCRYHDRLPVIRWPQLTEELNAGPFERERLEPAFQALGIPWLENGAPRQAAAPLSVDPRVVRARLAQAHVQDNAARGRAPVQPDLDLEADAERMAIQSQDEPL